MECGLLEVHGNVRQSDIVSASAIVDAGVLHETCSCAAARTCLRWPPLVLVAQSPNLWTRKQDLSLLLVCAHSARDRP